MRVFVTGITGTLGTALAELHAGRGDAVFGCARGEARVVEWLRERGRLATVLVGDACGLADRSTDVGRLLPSIDRVYHCAALKHVDVCERHPQEACAQNVGLTALLAGCCGERLVLVSSDKACLPQGVYGATKLLAERLAVAAGGAAVRLGNLIGSSGSVFRLWQRQLEEQGRITVTDPEMTRFFVPVRRAAEMLSDLATPGVVSIPCGMRAVRMGDMANALAGPNVDVVGAREGETRHQWLVAPGERCTMMHNHNRPTMLLGKGEACERGLSSEDAERWDVAELLREAGLR